MMKHAEIKAAIDDLWKIMIDRDIAAMPRVIHEMGTLKIGDKILVITPQKVMIQDTAYRTFDTVQAAVDAFIKEVTE